MGITPEVKAVDLSKYKGLYTSFLPREKVNTSEGIRVFGKVYYVKPWEDAEAVLSRSADSFMETLDNTIHAEILNHYGLTPSPVDVLTSLEEGQLPPRDYEQTNSLPNWFGKVTLKVLVDPICMPLARLGPDDRIMLLAYFNLEFNDD